MGDKENKDESVKANHERDFIKKVKDMSKHLAAVKIEAAAKGDTPSRKEMDEMFHDISSAMCLLANESAQHFTVEKGFNIGAVFHIFITSCLLHACLRLDGEWVKADLENALDNFHIIEEMADDLIKAGVMSPSTEETLDEDSLGLWDSNNKVVH